MGFCENGGEEENIIVADAIIIPLVIPSAKTYYIMSRLRLKRNERTLSHGCGVIVGGQIFVKWWGGGEHHCGRCNYQSPGYSLSENIQYMSRLRLKRNKRTPFHGCGVIVDLLKK